MLMHDLDAMGIAYSLKCQLSFNRSFSVHFRHEMSICKIGEVIHKKVAPMYRLVLGVPQYVGTNPGVGLTNWSTLTTWPGTVAILRLLRFLTPFRRHGLRCALPYAQPGHVGESTFSNSRGIKPARAISLRMENLSCPKCSGITASLCCLLWVKSTAGYSSISILLLGGKIKPDSIGDTGSGAKSLSLKVMVFGSLRFVLILALRSLCYLSLSGSIVCSITVSL